jgi:SAM-dependent methyltransferase
MIEEMVETPEQLAADAGQYWSQSAVRPWIADMSHWRGRGRWTNDCAWGELGERNLSIFHQMRSLVGHGRPIRNMLEWGPGGGANAVLFAPEVSRLYGVEISAPNLAECGRQLARTGFTGWEPIQVDAADPEHCLAAIDSPIDFALCTAVFQHFPGKEYGARVLRVIGELLADGGAALIQTRYDDGSEILRCKTRDYARNAVTFTSYGIDEFWHLAAGSGLAPISLLLRPEDRYAYYWLQKGNNA